MTELLWNIHYNLSALVLLLVVIAIFFTRKSLPLRLNQLYRSLLLLALVTTLLDTLTAFSISWYDQVPQSFNLLLNLVFLAFSNLIAPTFVLFVQEATIPRYHQKTWKHRIWFLPLAYSALALLTTPWTGFVFFFDSMGVYQWGPGMPHLFYINEFFILVSLGYVLVFRKALDFRHWLILSFFIVASIIAVLLQLLFPNILLVNFATALSLVLLYLSLQNPELGKDSITGVFNRSSFVTMVDLFLERKETFSILALALDDFKYINNTFGVLNGDRLIRSLVHWLEEQAPEQRVYRLGGDQFALILEDSPDTAGHVAQAVQSRFTEPWTVNSMGVSLSTCIAILSVPEDAQTLEDVIDGLDFSLLEAKKQKKGTVVFTRDLSVKPGMRSVEVEKAIRRALKQESFNVFFQPLWSNKEQRFASLEALVRLKDELLGVIPPDEFIPLAEKNGLILDIGDQVFRKICRMITSLDLKNRGIRLVEINLSPVQCMQEDLPQHLLGILEEWSIDPRLINLEITETTAMNSPEALAGSMRQLMQAGVSFALDDYGSGYSTIDYITSYNFHLVKIDKSIVWSFLDNPKAGTVLSHTVRMLKDLDMHIVAEGVETREQAEALISMGCDYMQGYYYSRPLPEEELLGFLEEAAHPEKGPEELELPLEDSDL